MSDLGVYLCFLCFSSVFSARVEIDLGELEGNEYLTKSGKNIFSFLGIPFARPPIGEDRFCEPQPAKEWTGVWPATKFSAACIQYVTLVDVPQKIIGNEDCLYLNVYTPTLEKTAKLPVLVYFHGGAFMFGDSKSINPDFLLDNDGIIFVSVNYRLGPFGFLSTEDKVVPGNNGLKDQVQALKWVRKNIAAFGGDKRKVTIAGNSAGGASVHFHYFSPLSKGLFDKGISSSGSALMPWALTKKPLQKAKMLALSLGCPTSGSEKMIKCLRQRPSKLILSKVSTLFMPWLFNPIAPFSPVIEGSSDKAFLSSQPYQLLKHGNVCDRPWLASVTSEEGLFPAAAFIDRQDLLKSLHENWTTIAPHLLDFNYTSSVDKLKSYSRKIKAFYGDSGSILMNNRIVEMLSDRLFKVGMNLAVRLQAFSTKSPVFFYVFGYRGRVSLTDLVTKTKSKFGVSHFDDMYYIMKFPERVKLESGPDKGMILAMTNIWASFVKTGQPSLPAGGQWNSVPRNLSSTGELPYLLITALNKMVPVSEKNFGNLQFWRSLGLEENE